LGKDAGEEEMNPPICKKCGFIVCTRFEKIGMSSLRITINLMKGGMTR
jgi:predicted Zn-ribbon and HTH transcriptional regulator